MMIIKRVALLLLISSSSLTAQDDDLFAELDDIEVEKAKVFATFKSTSLINGQTNETVKAKQLDFRITHRFGNVGGVGGGIHSLFGIDQAANIRFSLDYGITDRLQIGIGRSNTKEHLDGSVKYKIMEQKADGFPLSIVGFINTAITPEKGAPGQYPSFASRMSYSYQLILARKFNWRFSAALQPTLVHRNRVGSVVNPVDNSLDQNDLFALGVLGRLKLTHSFAIIGEYYYTFSNYRMNNTNDPYYMPLGLGIEIETGGHVFQLNCTNVPGIIYNDFIPESGSTWTDGGFRFGFTISRMFNLARKEKK